MKNKLLHTVMSFFFTLIILAGCSMFSIQKLIKDLKNKDPEIRKKAALMLASENLSPTEIWIESGTCILWDSSTVNLLGDELIKCLKDHDTGSRRYVVDALGDIKFVKASPLVIEALNDSDKWVRIAAVSTLRTFGDKAATPFLVEMLKRTSSTGESLTEDILRALGEIGDTSATSAILDCISSTNKHRWLYAGIEALGSLKDERAYYFIKQHINDTELGYVSLQALKGFNGKLSIPVFVQALRSFDLAKNTEPAELLSHYPDEAFEIVMTASKDEYGPLRAGAVYTLGLMGKEKSLEYLLEMLKDRDDIVKFSAKCALENRNYRDKSILKLKDLSTNNSGTTGLLADLLLCQYADSVKHKADDRLKQLCSYDDEESIYGAYSFYKSALNSYESQDYAIPFLITMLDNHIEYRWVPQGSTVNSENAKPTSPSQEAFQALTKMTAKYKDAQNLPQLNSAWSDWWKKHEGEYRATLRNFWQKELK
jgi:HEAT repeat protein